MPRLRLMIRIALLLALLVFTTRWVHGQVFVQPVPPRIISGADVGFRVTGLRGDTPVGVVVLRVNGRWVEAEIGGDRGRPFAEQPPPPPPPPPSR